MDEMKKLMEEAERSIKNINVQKNPVKEAGFSKESQLNQYSKNLRPCKSCGNLNDKSADVCPKCGKKLKSRVVLTLILVFFIIGVAGLIIGVVSNVGPIDTSIDRDRVAYQVSTTFVKQHLKAPATADFPPYDASFVKRLPDVKEWEMYEVTAYIDAQNSFGAQIRSTYTCGLTYNRTDTGREWKLATININ